MRLAGKDRKAKGEEGHRLPRKVGGLQRDSDLFLLSTDCNLQTVRMQTIFISTNTVRAFPFLHVLFSIYCFGLFDVPIPTLKIDRF